MASLKELNLRDKGIKNISGLEYAVNLVDLNLRNNKIVDIGPLAKLVKLEKLTIRENKIEDISPLAELTKLKDLSIHSNKVQDITPLENLQELEILTLRGNEISNLSPLKGLRELRDLNIRDNQITSLEALRGLEKLQGKGSRLHLDGNSITDYSPVANYYELIEDVDFVLTQGKEALMNKKALLIFLVLIIFITLPLVGCQKQKVPNLVINEVMASNGETITDAAGDYEDWLEIYNPSEEAIDLKGYYLSDKEDHLTRWQFPESVIIEAGGYLLVGLR